MRSSHYSKAHEPRLLSDWAEIKAGAIIAAFNATPVSKRQPPLLCYSGMSGIAHATALSIALYRVSPRFRFGMAYVRKSGEKSHGITVESRTQGDYTKYKPIFVDDFIDTGKTFKRVKQMISGEFGLDVKTVCLYNSTIGRKAIRAESLEIIL